MQTRIDDTLHEHASCLGLVGDKICQHRLECSHYVDAPPDYIIGPLYGGACYGHEGFPYLSRVEKRSAQ